jgi:broad specificity phosphatase PhoE
MTRVLLVRHARPAAAFEDDLDPGLDDTGRAEAEARAVEMAPCGAVAIVSSPLRRARETAAPLARRWRADVAIEPAFGEVPTPGLALADRGTWLRELLGRRWSDADAAVRAWRAALVAALHACRRDTVVFTHFVAINVAVGAATGDDRIVSVMPAHASVTELAVVDGGLVLVGETPGSAVARADPGASPGGSAPRSTDR